MNRITAFLSFASLVAVARLSAQLPPGNFWPNPDSKAGENLDSPEGTPDNWNRGGAARLMMTLASGDSLTVTDTMIIDDFSMRVTPPGFTVTGFKPEGTGWQITGGVGGITPRNVRIQATHQIAAPRRAAR